MKILKATYEIPFICLTMGRNGSCAYYHDRKVQMNAFVQEKTVDTTGAGDTFMGCVLNFVLDHGLDGLEEEEIRQMLRFPVQQHPSLQHVMELLKSCRIRKKYKNT